MPYTAYPVWMFPPNWGNYVNETLAWKTDIPNSEEGQEQRISRRLTPRRSFKATFLLTRAERQRFEMAMAGRGSYVWLIPLWHQVTKLDTQASAGTNTLSFDTRWREYVDGGNVILRGPNSATWEVGTIDAISASSLTLLGNLEATWKKGTMVYPARLARLQYSVSARKKTDTTSEVEIDFTLDASNPHASSGFTPPTYRGLGIVVDRPEDGEDLEFSYERNMLTLDNELSIPVSLDRSNRAFISAEYRWALIGRQAQENFRELLYSVRGSAGALWMPTFMSDFTLSSPASSGATTLAVENCGYTSMGVRGPGREDIRVELRDGTVFYRKILASVESSVAVETLTLDSGIPVGISPEQIVHISFMQPARLFSDTVEMQHLTDSDGLCVCKSAWRGTNAVIS